jgi:hypothetical protein
MIIYLLLLQYGISPNPGPENTKKSNLSFITYNCRGLMDGRKLRRVLAKIEIHYLTRTALLLYKRHIR